jgi:hypothetical protein
MSVILYDPSQDHEWPEIDRENTNEKCERKKNTETNTSLQRIHRPSTTEILAIVHIDGVKRARQFMIWPANVSVRSAHGIFVSRGKYLAQIALPAPRKLAKSHINLHTAPRR